MKRILIIILLTFISCTAQVKLTDWYGTSRNFWQIGKLGAQIKFNVDSSAYYIKYKNEFGVYDSAWIMLSNKTSSPWAINIEARQRQDADNNLQSLISAKASILSIDTLKSKDNILESRMQSAEASLLLKANKTTTDSLKTNLSSLAILKANVSTTDSLKNRMGTAEAGIQANASLVLNAQGEIDSLQSSLLLYAKRDSIISYINIAPDSVKISANKILLSGTTIADSLFGKTIVSPNIKTQISGKRIEINSSTNTIDFYNDTGTLIGKLDGTTTGGNSYLNSTSNIYAPAIYTDYMSVTSGVYQNILSNGQLFFIKQGAGTPAALGFDWSWRRLTLDGYMIPNFNDLTWDNIIGKPSTFTPSSHTHIHSDITDFYNSVYDYLVNSFDAASKNWVSSQLTWANIANKPTTLSGYGITDAAGLGLNNTFTGTNTFRDILFSGTGKFYLPTSDMTTSGTMFLSGSTINYYSTTGTLYSLATTTDLSSGLATKITNPTNAHGVLKNDGTGVIYWQAIMNTDISDALGYTPTYVYDSGTSTSSTWSSSKINTELNNKANSFTGFTGTIQIPGTDGYTHKLIFSNGVLISYEKL